MSSTFKSKLEIAIEGIMRDKITSTAEDEDPNCCKCVHVCDDFPCEKLCGPAHYWQGYRRE